MLLSYVSGALGAEFGEAVANEMIAAGPRPPHTSQRRRSDMSNRIEDERILAAITIMRENLKRRLASPKLRPASACRNGSSRSWKNKLGSCPHRYYARERINRACSLLIFSDMSIEEIACACGIAQARCFLAPSAISLAPRHDVTESDTETRSLRQFVYLAEFFGSGD